jgi:hypothetical protein
MSEPLNKIDSNSETWRAVQDQLRTWRSESFQRLVSEGCQERESDFQRGRISLADDLLKVPAPVTRHVPTFISDGY